MMRLHPGNLCVAFCTGCWRRWRAWLCARDARRTSRSSCCATNSQSCTGRTTGQCSPMRTGPCWVRSRRPCPDGGELAGSSRQRPCCVGTDAESPATGPDPAGRPGVWVPTIRSWALTRGFALHPGTRNRHEIRYTRTQHRPPSRQANDHGRVSDTHRWPRQRGSPRHNRRACHRPSVRSCGDGLPVARPRPKRPIDSMAHHGRASLRAQPSQLQSRCWRAHRHTAC